MQAGAGQQAVRNSSMDQLVNYRTQLQEDLARVEQNIAEQEERYFSAEHSLAGSVMKGFEGFLSTKDAMRKRTTRGWKPEDRWFSLSSKTSPVTAELENQEQAEQVAGGGFGKKGYAQKGYAQKGRRT